MKASSLECILEHVGNSFSLSSDTNTTMYESEYEANSFSLIGGGAEVG